MPLAQAATHSPYVQNSPNRHNRSGASTTHFMCPSEQPLLHTLTHKSQPSLAITGSNAGPGATASTYGATPAVGGGKGVTLPMDGAAAMPARCRFRTRAGIGASPCGRSGRTGCVSGKAWGGRRPRGCRRAKLGFAIDLVAVSSRRAAQVHTQKRRSALEALGAEGSARRGLDCFSRTRRCTNWDGDAQRGRRWSGIHPRSSLPSPSAAATTTLQRRQAGCIQHS